MKLQNFHGYYILRGECTNVLDILAPSAVEARMARHNLLTIAEERSIQWRIASCTLEVEVKPAQPGDIKPHHGLGGQRR